MAQKGGVVSGRGACVGESTSEDSPHTALTYFTGRVPAALPPPLSASLKSLTKLQAVIAPFPAEIWLLHSTIWKADKVGWGRTGASFIFLCFVLFGLCSIPQSSKDGLEACLHWVLTQFSGIKRQVNNPCSQHHGWGRLLSCCVMFCDLNHLLQKANNKRTDLISAYFLCSHLTVFPTQKFPQCLNVSGIGLWPQSLQFMQRLTEKTNVIPQNKERINIFQCLKT